MPTSCLPLKPTVWLSQCQNGSKGLKGLAQRRLAVHSRRVGVRHSHPCSAQSSQSDWSSAAHGCLSVCLCAAVEKEHIVDSGGLAALLGLTDASDVRTTAGLAATTQALA